jgi:branched-chain amino acid transport system permease protein
MTLILEAVVFGVLTGGVYALMASGLTLIFGVMRIINVGHGALVILGAYLSYALLSSGAHIDPFLSLVITMPAMFILGVVLQLAFIRPLKEDREALSVLVTYAVALGIEGLLGFIFTNNFVQLNAWYQTASFAFFGFRIAYVYVFGFALCVAILAAMFLMLYRTPFGAAIRATMLNRTAAQLVGVNVDRVSAIAFGIGVATAAAGGVVFGMTNSFDPGSHYDLISRLLTIIVLGGLGSLRGAIIGAIGMLIVTDVASVVISPVWANFAFFVILVAVLVVRPQGLYGIRVRERI